MAPGHADVLIIGAGASGGVAGRRLAEAGLSVVALEQGKWQDPANYRGSEWDWELTAAKQWSPFPDIRQSPDDYPIDLSQSDMKIMNFNGVGGGTILYNGVWNRLPPSTFEERSRFGFGDDWPISYDDLVTFYERTDRDVGVSGLAGNPAYPPGAELPLPSLPISPGAMKVARAFHAKGWHWWPDTNAIISTPYDGRHPCVQRGTCPQGCNEGAKSSIDLTHWKRFVTLGGRLETSAWVSRIIVGDDGRAIGAEWIDARGVTHFQSADTVLVAANGIGTPRLLLASACDRFPDGLANSSGLVGKRLMLHPTALVFGVFGEDIESWSGRNGSTVQCLEFAQDDPTRGFRGGAKWALHPSGAPLAAAMAVLASGADPSEYHARHAERFGRTLFWSIMVGDFPEDENRVVLSETVCDAAGTPAPKVIYRTSEDMRRALSWNVERATEIFHDAGAKIVEAFDPAGINAHLMGTARMGDDPATSVVDRWCMSHDIPNLGVIDGSVFVTSGVVNPTSTICALALRTAERLIEGRGSLPAPQQERRSIFDYGAVETSSPASIEPREPLPDAERARLVELGDAFIPAIEDVPGAGQLLGAGPALDRVLDVRPDLLSDLRRALADPAGDTVGHIRTLAAKDPAAWNAVATIVAGAYYADPKVRARIRYEGQVARPQAPDRYPAYIEEGLLDRVLSDGWREAWENAGQRSAGVCINSAASNFGTT